jgi:outer membrane protein TolC
MKKVKLNISTSIKNCPVQIGKSIKPVQIIIICFFLCQSVFSFSQSDSLMKYLEIAAKNNPGVLQKFTEYKASLQKVPQVGSLPDPELSMGVFLKPMELVGGNQIADFRLMQMFPWFGVLKNAKDEMSLMAKAKFELFRDTKLGLFYDVQRTWYQLIKYQQDINISQSNLDVLKTIERLALVRFKSPPANGTNSYSGSVLSQGASSINSSGSSVMQSMGSGSGNVAGTTTSQASVPMAPNSMGSQAGSSGLADLYRIQIEIADLENSIESLKNLMVTITARFNTYLNRPVISAVALPDTLRPEVFGLSPAAVTDSMLINNPMLGMLKYEKQSLDARYRMVSRMGYPMVGLGLNYSLINVSEMSTSSMNNGMDMIMPMVTVTLPVYRKKYKSMKSEAELLRTAASLGIVATSNSLQAEFYEAIQMYQDAKRRQKLYADQSQLAENSLDIMLKSFSSSGAGLTDILRIRQQLLDYKFKLVEAVVDFNTAVAWLKRLGNLEEYENK